MLKERLPVAKEIAKINIIMDMGTHIETIILIFRNTRVTLVHFKVSQETIKFILMRLDEIPSNSCTLLGIYELI